MFQETLVGVVKPPDKHYINMSLPHFVIQIMSRRNYRFKSYSKLNCFTKAEFIALTKEKVPLNEFISDLSKDLKKFQGTLQHSDICKSDITVVIALLLKVTRALNHDDDEIRLKSITLLYEALSDRCINFQNSLNIFVKGTENLIQNESAASDIEATCNLFEAFLVRLPEISWSILPLDELYETVQLLHEVDFTGSSDLVSKVKYLIELRNTKKCEHKVKVSHTASEPKKTWDNSEYCNLQILPQWEELKNPKPPYQLRPNVIEGSYEDWMHYFDVQFRLLREDFMSPLRKGIADYFEGKCGRDLRNVKLYNRVRIEKPLFTRAGLCHKITFDVTPFRGYRWEHSKRLIFGSLLCLSPDHFQDKVLLATVSNRNPRDISRGILEVMFQGSIELLAYIKQQTQFVMVESVAYFEASRHILRSLQKVAKRMPMPFSDYLIKNECKYVHHPKYLGENEDSTYDIQFIVKPIYRHCRGHNAFTTMCITEPSQWPTVKMTDLDDSQLKAVKMALTQEVAVIQGPPGTGKTYIGLKIVQALLNNRKVWNRGEIPNILEGRRSAPKSPILVMCLTNHALDQFLEGILDKEENSSLTLIRIGGRSKSEKIAERSLYNVKRKLRNVPSDEYKEMRAHFDRATTEGEECEMMLQNYHDPKYKFVRLQEMRCVIEEHLYSSLIQHTETEEEETHALELWLGLYQKEEIVEYQPVITHQDEESSESDSDESSFSSSDSPMEEKNFSEDPSSEAAAIEMVPVTGEANIEEDARHIDGLSEMFEELTFKKAASTTQSNPSKVKITHHRRRTTKIVECDNQSQVRRAILGYRKMSPNEVAKIHDVYDLVQVTDRYRLYMSWHSRYREHLLQELEEKCRSYNEACERANEAKQLTDYYALKTADVIGMTTTGAAKYQHVLHLVKPKIVIVEEAAEVMESHIVSALNSGTQHLILIGDHKQLRPNPNEYDLAIKYKLDISLFERLVMNNIPCVTLQIQHRMRPDIADLVRGHVYDTLYDHESVKDYPSVKGVAKNLFLIHHNEPERANELSKSNEHEAAYLAALCKFLLQQGYSPTQITVLVTYTGQLLLMKKEAFEGVRVTTVDNFQGEENDIVLLSLVRSNDHDKIGFLKAENRVCVAFSRAKHGFYCIGNFEMLRRNAPIWESIVADMAAKGNIGDRLSVHCNNHPDYKYNIKYPKEFSQYLPTGGCQRPCEYRLPCGHVCERTCHSNDPDHQEYQCKKPCPKRCESCGRQCTLQCYRECKCTAIVQKAMPYCGHLVDIACYLDPTELLCEVRCIKVIRVCGHEQEFYCYKSPDHAKCRNMCKKRCPKGHPCPLPCYQQCLPCEVTSTVKLPGCGHKQEKYCFQNPEDVKCRAKCERKCSQGHSYACPRMCYQDCEPCNAEVTVTLPCGHETRTRCSKRTDIKCRKMVTKKFPCSHKIQVRCFESGSVKCQEKVSKTLLCSHNVEVRCFEMSTAKCSMPCQKVLPCKHKCPSLCGEPCGTRRCREQVEVTVPLCQHRVKVACGDRSYRLSSYKCAEPCQRKLPCGHKCTNKCSEPCTEKCLVAGIKWTCDYGHTQILTCFETVDARCEVRVCKSYPCDHKHYLSCCTEIEEKPCDIYCRAPLACGHYCRGKCSDCWATRIHKPCEYHVIQSHYCGESIKMNCTGLGDCHELKAVDMNSKPRALHCMHREIPYGCTTEDYMCTQPCRWECPHYKCTKLCHEPCNRPACEKRCPEIMECGHQCIGLCGEPCITVCHECNPSTFLSQLRSHRGYSTDQVYTQLPCGHIFTVNEMDKHTTPDSNSFVQPLQCPECFGLISCSYRYGNRMKEALLHVDAVRAMIKTSSAQSNLSAERRSRLKHLCNSSVTRSPLSLTTTSLYSAHTALQDMVAKLSDFTSVRRDEGFVHVLLAKVLSMSCTKPDSTSAYQPILNFLMSIIRQRSIQLSFQTIHDLISEMYRLYAITKSSLSFLMRFKHPHTRMSVNDLKSYSKLFDLAAKTESTEDFIGDIEYFLPVISRGCWMKCRRGHYNCIPVSIPGTLRTQCPQCTGAVKTPVDQYLFHYELQGSRKSGCYMQFCKKSGCYTELLQFCIAARDPCS